MRWSQVAGKPVEWECIECIEEKLGTGLPKLDPRQMTRIQS